MPEGSCNNASARKCWETQDVLVAHGPDLAWALLGSRQVHTALVHLLKGDARGLV